MLGKHNGKVKNLAMKREEMKEVKWAKWFAERQPAIEQNKNSGKPIVKSQQANKVVVKEAEKTWRTKKQQFIEKAKNLEVEGKGNEDESLGEEHASDMTGDEDMQAEIEKHIEAEGEGTENKQEGEGTEHTAPKEGEGTENEPDGEGSCLQRCSACGWKRPDRGIVECKACGAMN